MTLGGVVVPTPTLFDADGGLASEANAAFLEGLVREGIDHLFVLGSLGEFAAVEDAERTRLLRAAVSALRVGSDLWVGVGAPSTARAVRYAREAEALGAAAVVAVPPYYLRPTDAEIAAYYRALHEAVRLPLLAYNIPSKVGYALPKELVHRLAREGVLAGIKDTAGSRESLARFLGGAPSGFAVLPGDDGLAQWAIGNGAVGAVMGTANVVPKLARALVASTRDGPAARAESLQGRVERLVDAVFSGPFPATVKFLAHRFRGAPEGYRAPYGPLTPSEVDTVLAKFRPLEGELAEFR